MTKTHIITSLQIDMVDKVKTSIKFIWLTHTNTNTLLSVNSKTFGVLLQFLSLKIQIKFKHSLHRAGTVLLLLHF